MKKKWLNRGFALGLTLVTAFGLCACGDEGKSMENAGMAKEHVYKLSQIEIPNLGVADGKGNTSIMQTLHKDERIFVLLRNDSWDPETYESSVSYELLSMDEDGGNQNLIEIQIPASEEPDEAGDGEAENPMPDEEGEGVSAADPDGEEGESTTEQSEEESGEDDAASVPSVQPRVSVMDMPMVGQNVSEYSNYGNFVINSEGELYGLKTLSRDEYIEEEESWKNERRYYICHWATDGSFQWEKEIEALASDDDMWIYVETILARNDGTLELIVRGDNNARIKVDAEGNVSDQIPLPDELESVYNNLERMLPREDGVLFLIYHDENDWQKIFGVEYDLATETMGEPCSLPSSVLYAWDYNIMNIRANGDLLFTTSGGVYTYTIGDEAAKPMMDYINSDVFINSFSAIVELSDTSFLGIYLEDYSEGNKAAVFSYVDPADITDKAVVVLAGEYIDYDMKKRVIEFNRESEDYRIVIKEYNLYNTYEDYNAGNTKLNNDIISGNMPDILVNNEYASLPIENYIAKGLIADVRKLIADDEELSQKEFIESVFDAYSVDGKLYYVVPNFEVYTMIAKKSLVGDRESWTIEDMKQVLAGMGEEASAFGIDITRETFVNMVLRYCGNQFMDVSTGKCNFNSDDFIALMEFAKTLPEEINREDDYWMNYDWSKEQTQYRENRTLLMQANFYYFQNFPNTFNGYFGEPVSFVGFPTGEGKGDYLQSSRTYALSARSRNLEGAWQFIRYYLTDEYQKEVNYFPVNKELFYERSKEAMERPYWEDENGEKQYYDQTISLNGEEVTISPLTQEQLDEVLDYILSVDNRFYYNEAIANIVNEEMGGFFTGQKSVQDVVAVIQSRAQIYVDENR